MNYQEVKNKLDKKVKYEEVDNDRIWEDDFYTEELREKTSKLQSDIEDAYLQFLNEKE